MRKKEVCVLKKSYGAQGSRNKRIILTESDSERMLRYSSRIWRGR